MPTIPAAANADGNVAVWWVAAIANTSSPSAAAITAGVLLHCYLTPDGWVPGLDESATVDDRLCSPQTFEGKGRSKRSLTLKYVENPAVPASNLAFTTLIPGTEGFLVERRGVNVDTAAAAAQLCNVWPVQMGEYQPQPPEANSKLKQMQTAFVRDTVKINVVMAA